jgi:hypothetical protein
MKDNKTQNTDEIGLTEQEVWSVINYARALSQTTGMMYLTPDLINARMRDVTLNPMAATQTALDEAMADPKNNEKQLQGFSQNFELQSMVYKRLLSYLANMLSFDITYTSNAKPDDYKTPKYKKDLDAIERFLDNFDYKKEFHIAIREMLRNDAYFACFRAAGNRFVLQELPSEYCKITGRWENGFLFSFNMYWFLQPGVDIDMYPDFFKKKYKELWQNPNTNRTYEPSLPPELRAKSSWIYWVDIPPSLGVCFKLTPELAARLPYFSPLFNDLILQGLMRNLQKNINMAAASRIIMGEVPMLNKDAKVTVKDSIAISPDLLGKFMALIKSAISEAVKVGSAPLQNIQAIGFDTDNELYDSYLKTALASSGINTNLIFTSNIKPNVMETQLSINVDEQMLLPLYEQFSDFINYQLSKWTKTYRFSVVFEGTEFSINREKRFETVMKLFGQGIVLPQKISAALGMKPAQFRRQMEEAKAMGFMDMLTPPSVQTAEQMMPFNPKPPLLEKGEDDGSSGRDKPPRGRPKKKDSDISEEGMLTRGSGGNIGRGGKSP